MVSGLWGRKIGMTQVFTQDKVVPVTAIDLGNWFVTGLKTEGRDGYNAVQIGCLRNKYTQHSFSKVWLKNLKKYFEFVREVKLSQVPVDIKIGQVVNFDKVFSEGDQVDVFGKTRGRGFAGVVRRHGFAGPPGSHGSTMGKRPGSIGFMTSQGKVIKGKKMPGHLGNKQRVVENLDIVRLEKEGKIVLVKGAIPGHAGSLVFIRKVVGI